MLPRNDVIKHSQKKWGVVVVEWSACSPSTLTIRVRIRLKPTVFSVKFGFEKNENKQKEAGVRPFFKKTLTKEQDKK